MYSSYQSRQHVVAQISLVHVYEWDRDTLSCSLFQRERKNTPMFIYFRLLSIMNRIVPRLRICPTYRRSSRLIHDFTCCLSNEWLYHLRICGRCIMPWVWLIYLPQHGKDNVINIKRISICSFCMFATYFDFNFYCTKDSARIHVISSKERHIHDECKFTERKI